MTEEPTEAAQEETFSRAQMDEYGAKCIEAGLIMFQNKIKAFEASHVVADMKFRNGEWWMRGVTVLRPRGHKDGPSECAEVTGATFEECLDKLFV